MVGIRRARSLAWAFVLVCESACGSASDGEPDGSTDVDPPNAGTGGTGSTTDAGTIGGGSMDGGGGDGAVGCDLAGAWIVQRVLFTTPVTPLAPGAQKVSNWDLYEVTQDGDAVTVTDHLFCGLVITGDARVGLSDDSIHALQARLDQSERDGTFTASGTDCMLTLERVYIVMGASPIAYYRAGVEAAPGRIDGDPELSVLEPMPTVAGNPGADDWDGDDKPGIAFIITDSPLGSGVRHDTQRDWHEMQGVVPMGSTDFRVDVTWDFEETVIEATNPFFASVAIVRDGSPHSALWRRVDDTIRGADDIETCRNVRELMPHAPTPREAL